MDGLTQCQIEIRRLRGVIREQEAEGAGVIQAIGREYDKAKEREENAVTDTRRSFCAGMSEAYKNALAILTGERGGGMRGFLYRLATAVKDAGERWNFPPLIRVGLALRGRL